MGQLSYPVIEGEESRDSIFAELLERDDNTIGFSAANIFSKVFKPILPRSSPSYILRSFISYLKRRLRPWVE
jgi:hypothetical protein